VHADPGAQVLPHLPQLPGSVPTSTQLTPQSWVGGAHAPPELALAPPEPNMF